MIIESMSHNEVQMIYKVCMKLIGPVRPVGVSETDEERLENIKVLCELQSMLLGTILEIESRYSNYKEASIHRCADYAHKHLKSIGL